MTASRPRERPSILIFGGGWLGQAVGRDVLANGGTAWLTSRSGETRIRLTEASFHAVDPEDAAAL